MRTNWTFFGAVARIWWGVG